MFEKFVKSCENVHIVVSTFPMRASENFEERLFKPAGGELEKDGEKVTPSDWMAYFKRAGVALTSAEFKDHMVAVVNSDVAEGKAQLACVKCQRELLEECGVHQDTGVMALSAMGQMIQQGKLDDKAVVKAIQRFQITCNIAVVQAYKSAGKEVPPQVQAMINQGVWKEGTAEQKGQMPPAGADMEAQMAAGAMSNIRAGADYDKYASSGAGGKKKKGASMEK
jgi:hypothetical protein